MIPTEKDVVHCEKAAQVSLCPTNHMWTGMLQNPNLRVKRLATNRMSNVTVASKRNTPHAEDDPHLLHFCACLLSFLCLLNLKWRFLCPALQTLLFPYWTLFLKLNASHALSISIAGAVTSWKLLRLLVWTPLKIRMKNLVICMFSSGTLCSRYKVFTDVSFWAQFTQICTRFGFYAA